MAKSVGKGVREKLRRAHMHREDFERRVTRFVDSGAYSVIREDDPETRKRSWIVQVHKRPPLTRWGALIGECLFNFRSALDHLAYDLAVAHSGFPLSPEVERDSEFPIYVDRAPTKAEWKRKLGAVHPEARDLIQKMQPYGRKDRAALKYLHLLHNFDKHRTLHLVSGVSRGLVHSGDDPGFEILNFRAFEHGDVLARAPFPSSPKQDHDPQFFFGVAFSKTGPGGTAPEVTLTLRWIGEHIDKGVIEPLLPFL